MMLCRDDITLRHFNQRIDFRPVGDRTFAGIPFDAALAARLCGALDGAIVELTVDDHAEQAVFTVTHPLLAQPAVRILDLLPRSRLLHINNDLRLTTTGTGLGVRMLAHQVDAARSLGVGQITLWTGAGFDRGLALNGSYTWARCGFDADLPYPHDGGQKYIRVWGAAERAERTTPEIRARIAWLQSWPEELRHAARIQDVMLTEAGRRWWKNCPDGVEMTFDVHVGSLSSQVLDAYMKAKGVRITAG